MKFTGTKDYVATDDLKIAVNASIVLERPLLIKGEPGTGKTVLAEEVAKVNPDLVINDPNGKPYTVRYEAVNAMLLNEFLKEHGIVQKQQATIALQESQIKALIAGLREQATQIQKVSAQIEMIKPAPQVVENR